MIKKYKIKEIWLAVGVFSMILLGFHWLGYDSRNMEVSILVLNSIGFALVLPCSLFIVPVAVASSIYLGIQPIATEGIYLNTIFIFVIGMMQWFFIARFWSPDGMPFQKLDLKEEGLK